jgi:signal transduction histidine kinase
MTVRRHASPTTGLLIGLLVTLAAVVASAGYFTRQIAGLRLLQTDIVDRHRRDSLQLLRIQNDLNLLGLAMRDMLDNEEGYPLTAWSAQFDRVRVDLDAALRQQEEVAVASRTEDQREYLTTSVRQFWDAVDRIFALAGAGREEEARDQIRLSLQARQAALATAVARQLVQNNEAEQETAARIETIYAEVQRHVYFLVAAALTTIVITSLYLIRSNRRLFAALEDLSDSRQELAQQLITARESTLREVARELHDDLGQVLTAIGSMLGRAARQLPAGSPLEADLQEIRAVAQTTLDNVRGLSQTLHPSILEEAGLEGTIRWYVATAERQTGLTIDYECTGAAVPIGDATAIHVYRILQEAVSNAARHSGGGRVWVRLQFTSDRLVLEVEDHGRGYDGTGGGTPRRGLGIVTMRERAALIGGELIFVRPAAGGTLVRLTVPVP